MSDVQFDQVVELALRLSPAEQARLMERLAASVHDILAVDESTETMRESVWTDEEIAEMMKVEPMTGAEIVEAGLLGGWVDMDIADGAEWVNEQKRQRKEKQRW